MRKGEILALGAVVAVMTATMALVAPPAPKADPDVLSIRLLDEDVAHDLWEESKSLGEKTCLTELNDGGLRYWLHSCEEPKFTNG